MRLSNGESSVGGTLLRETVLLINEEGVNQGLGATEEYSQTRAKCRLSVMATLTA